MFQDLLELYENYGIAAVEDIFSTLLDSAALLRLDTWIGA